MFRRGPHRECGCDMREWNFRCVTSAEVLGKLEQTQQEMHQGLVNSSSGDASRLIRLKYNQAFLRTVRMARYALTGAYVK